MSNTYNPPGSMSDTSYLDDHERPEMQTHADRFGWVEAREGRGTYPDGWTVILDQEAGGAIAAFASMSAAQEYYDYLVQSEGNSIPAANASE